MPNRRRFLLQACLAVLASPLLPAQSTTQPVDEEVRASIQKFSQIYEVVESNFADKIDPDRVVYRGAIPSMLRTLDPHSNFFDPKAYALLREGQSGHYFGVGMLIGAPEGKVLVMHPFQASPASRAGLRPGDEIVSVNGTSTERADVPKVSSLLRGPRGTSAIVKVRRLGAPEPLTFTMVRDNVPRDSVNYAFWIRPGIAYMKIDAFNETTSREVDKALTKLGESSIEGLVLDLRDNPGGLVQEAVNVADRFLRKGQPIVTHHGRASAETKFVARKGERGPEYPIVVLVNRGTASAAEILSGALQDHDRALIFGENTFGKGLVQAPFPLTGNAALMLTIAKYYTPSGRLIQRDYTRKSLYEYYNRGEGRNNEKDMRKTDSGRIVFGGDGISPDQRFGNPDLTPFETELLSKLAFFFFAPEYFSNHPATLAKDWIPDPEVVDSFRAFISKRDIKFTPEDFERERTWVRDHLRYELLVTALSKEDSDRVVLENDPEVLKAVDSLPSAKALVQKAQIVARQSKKTPESTSSGTASVNP
jgi:carboxyl-terminal processing protease